VPTVSATATATSTAVDAAIPAISVSGAVATARIGDEPGEAHRAHDRRGAVSLGDEADRGPGHKG
jgi:hypothetical protein